MEAEIEALVTITPTTGIEGIIIIIIKGFIQDIIVNTIITKLTEVTTKDILIRVIDVRALVGMTSIINITKKVIIEATGRIITETSTGEEVDELKTFIFSFFFPL